jgi:hypothetical protein
MRLLLNLRGVNNTLNYPKDTQLNTPSPRPRTCDTALRVVLHGDRPAQPCNFFYPIDFVVKHPVAPEINPVPTLGWVRTALLFSAAQRSTSEKMLIFEQSSFATTERDTAGPSASLGMTKWRVVSHLVSGLREREGKTLPFRGWWS